MTNICGVKEKASAGKTFVVLSFEGETKRDLDGELGKFAAVTTGNFLARIDEQSTLEDGAGQKLGPALLKANKGRQLIFEVPVNAAGLVWSNGKQRVQLEPHPVLLEKEK